SDIAHAHTVVLNHLKQNLDAQSSQIFNLGTGNGVTVLEAIAAFERVSGKKLNFQIGPRREGDVIAIYANNNAARETLNWHPKYSLDDMMLTAWNWEKRLKTDETIFNGKAAELN